MGVSEHIISWYNRNKRDLPWRKTRDPYLIWLSEIILQQTRVDQGLPYYYKFSEKYPDVKAFAGTPEEEVMKLWQGLGYYSRARNMHATAKIICDTFNGSFPGTYEELIKLKGIGEYTAAAISSFAFNEVKAVVDGNVYRVLTRYFGVADPIDSIIGKKKIKEIATELISKTDPATYNQAIMEFGARQCIPKNPDCNSCPLAGACYAFKEKAQDALPVKSKKTKQRHRFFNYLVVSDGSNYLIQQRTQKDIWQNLYEFPLIESTSVLNEEEMLSSKEWNDRFSHDTVLTSVSKPYKHILSHQVIYCKFWKVNIRKDNPFFNSALRIPGNQPLKYAIPKLIDNYLEEEGEIFEKGR